MQWVRGCVIVGLMLGLPVWAVLGDASGFSSLLTGDDETQARADVEIDDQRQPEEPLSHNEANGTSSYDPDPSPGGVFPKFKPATESPAETAEGKRLRSAVYWPEADGDPKLIHRIPAERVAQRAAVDETVPTIEAMAQELRALGARRYRMEESAGNYAFVCEFPSQSAASEPVVFEAQSPDRTVAVQQVLRQARDWRGDPR